MAGERVITTEAVLEDASVILAHVHDNPEQLAQDMRDLQQDLETAAQKSNDANPMGEPLAVPIRRYSRDGVLLREVNPEHNALRLNSHSLYIVGPVARFGTIDDSSAHALVQEFPDKFGKFVKLTFWLGEQDHELRAADVLIARRSGCQGLVLESNTRIGVANSQATVIETTRRPSVQ